MNSWSQALCRGLPGTPAMHVIFLTATLPRKPLFSFPNSPQMATSHNAESVGRTNPLVSHPSRSNCQNPPAFSCGLTGTLAAWWGSRYQAFPRPVHLLHLTCFPNFSSRCRRQAAHQDRRTVSIFPRRATFLPTIVAYFVHKSSQNSHRQRKRSAGDRLATGGLRSANGPPSPQQDGRHR